VSVAIVVMVGYLIVRNEPLADKNLVVETRTLLSLATAVLGATIPGFLHVTWRGRGGVIRAGGALALFVLTYWLTPTVLPALDERPIEPLRHPRRTSRSRLYPALVLTAGAQQPTRARSSRSDQTPVR
jgi:hypothetical protein